MIMKLIGDIVLLYVVRNLFFLILRFQEFIKIIITNFIIDVIINVNSIIDNSNNENLF